MEKASRQQVQHSGPNRRIPNNDSRPLTSRLPSKEVVEINTSTLMQMKQKLYPPFFSEKGLAQDILELTKAEPDVPLNAFIALKVYLGKLFQNKRALEDKWNNFLGNQTRKGILHSPEHLMGDQDVFQLRAKLPTQEDEVFKHFKQVRNSVDDLKDHVQGLNIFDEKEIILKLLGDVKAFYNDYQEKVLTLCKEDNPNAVNVLSDLIKPKAIMFGDMLPKGPAYRISRDNARHILSLDHHGGLLPKKPGSNHHVSFLPENEDPQVFFKADGEPNLKPGKEAMLYSLYRLLDIPVPQTALLMITGVKDNNSDFYVAQASEAVLGESSDIGISSKEKLDPKTDDFLSFCKQTVGAILTDPADGKRNNFIYSQKKHSLVSIDNDDVFCQNFSETWDKKGYLIQTKSLLFCLQAMDQPIPRSFSSFLITLDPQLLLLAWLDELKEKNKEYGYLEGVLCFENARQKFQKILPHKEFFHINRLLNDPIEFYSLRNNSLRDLCLPITLSIELLDSLQTKFSQIQRVLSDNNSATLQELLEKTSPHLGGCYRELRKKFMNPFEALDAVFAKNGPSSHPSFVSSLIDISSIPLEIQSSESNSDAKPGELFSSLYQSVEEKNSNLLDEVLKKHGERHMKGLLQPEEALKELFHLMNMKLGGFQDSEYIVDFWYKGRKEIKNSMDIIEQWDAFFFSLDHPELRWLFNLEKYLARGWRKTQEEYPKQLVDIKGAFIGKRSLSEGIMNQIFGKSGAFKKEERLPGRSQVAIFPKEDPIFYFKKYPEIPGYEYAATLLMRSLGLEGIPFSELLLFQDLKQGLYPVLLSQAVQGDLLDTIWKDDSNFTSLDPHHTHLLILCSMLLNPEDGKGDNYILTPDKRRIIPIDNDHVFLSGIIEEARGFFSKTIYTELQSKTVLYCLHEMNRPVPSSVTQIFAQFPVSIDKFIENWLRKLVIVNENYQNLPPKDLLVKEGKKGTFFRIAIPQGYIENLYTKLEKMKELLSKSRAVTPFEILKYLEPYVGKLYWDVFQQESTVQGRFMRLTDSLYKKDPNDHQISKINSIQMFKILDIPESELKDEAFLCKMGPQKALNFLAELKEAIMKDKDSYQSIIQGRIRLRKIDASKHSKDEDKVIFKILLEQNREILAYHNSQHLSLNSFEVIFKRLPPLNACNQIKLLDLRGAKKFTSVCFKLLSDSFPYLEYLNLSGNHLLEAIAFLNEDFKNLKRLALSHCPNLKTLLIASSLLDVLEINNNEKLISCCLDVQNLTYLDFTDTPRRQLILCFNKMETPEIIKPVIKINNIFLNVDETYSEISRVLNSFHIDSLLERGKFLIEQQNDCISQHLTEKFTQWLDELDIKLDWVGERLIQIEQSFESQEKLLDDTKKFVQKPSEISNKMRFALQNIHQLKDQRSQKSLKIRTLVTEIEVNGMHIFQKKK